MVHRRSLPGVSALAIALALLVAPAAPGQDDEPIRPPTNVAVKDHPFDGGKQIDLAWSRSPDDPGRVAGYNIYISLTPAQVEEEDAKIRAKAIAAAKGEKNRDILGETWDGDLEGIDADNLALLRVRRAEAAEQAGRDADAAAAARAGEVRFKYLDNVPAGTTRFTVDELSRHEAYLFQVAAFDASGNKSERAASPAEISPGRQWFDGSRFYFMIITILFCGAVIYWIDHARRGKPINVRKIAGLEAVDEAVGRATEMGRSCLYIAGTQDINEIQTIASMTVLSRVAKTAAEYDAKVEVPTSRSLVMATARETVQAAFLAAGRPDAYNQDLIYYVTDEQFGFVAYLSGMMVREKPAACFYMGAFYAESLILAETGNSIGAIQVAGTAMPAQLPFFVAACDYTLIGEEFFAASAYLSGSPEELGSLKGQDVGKVIVALLLLVGITLATVAAITDSTAIEGMVDFLKNTILT
jgi:hypothetical protein